MLLCASSPYARRGELWEAFKKPPRVRARTVGAPRGRRSPRAGTTQTSGAPAGQENIPRVPSLPRHRALAAPQIEPGAALDCVGLAAHMRIDSTLNEMAATLMQQTPWPSRRHDDMTLNVVFRQTWT
jgi:hypothetical protein